MRAWVFTSATTLAALGTYTERIGGRKQRTLGNLDGRGGGNDRQFRSRSAL